LVSRHEDLSFVIPRLPLSVTVEPLYEEFLDELERGGFAGEIRRDYATRLVASTDNSVYQIVPQAVVFPRSRDDVVAIGRLAGEARFAAIRLLPRGGGTGTNGGSLGTGLCVDLSKYMNRILDFDAAAGLVRVEPGVVLDQLNAYLKPHAVFFAPHVAPSDRATLGGMIANDACGQGSRLYGRTSRHVESLDLVLADGSAWRTKILPLDEAAGAAPVPPRIAAARHAVAAAARDHADLIRERFPAHDRFLTGYDLAHATRGGGVDLSALICGSEGTLAFVVEAALRVTPIPAHRRLVAITYASFDAALAAANALLRWEPAAIETIDDTVLNLARGDLVWPRVAPRLAAGGESSGGLNLVELAGAVAPDIDRRVHGLIAEAVAGGALAAHRIDDAGEVAAFWALRNRGVGLLGGMAGARRPVPFVEDCAVPPQRLAGFVAELRALLDRHHLKYGMYGHADVGCLHVRPALDLRDPADVRLLRHISDRVFAIVQSYGGVFWGEHGKGLRSVYNPAVFGPVLYEDLCRIKAAFDPLDQMNPGKIAVAGATARLAELDAPTRGARDRQIGATAQTRYETAIACNGNGACFTWDVDTAMCPSMKATADRIHSPKGRATLMREWLRQLSVDGWSGAGRPRAVKRLVWADPRAWWRRARSPQDFSHEVFDAFDGCLSCKACVAQCPVHVDIPAFKSEFLQAYHQRYPRRLADHAVAAMEETLPRVAGTPLAAALHWGGERLAPYLGLVDLPAPTRRTAEQVLRERGARRIDWRPPVSGGDPQVALIPDAFTNFFEPEPFVALYDIVRAAGREVAILPYRPSGKARHVKGFLAEFEDIAAANAADLAGLAARGIELLCVEPAVALLLRQEYASRKGTAQFRVDLPQEWLARNAAAVPRAFAGELSYALLSHCTESTTAAAANALWEDVFAAAGLRLEMPPVGCCGMAGAWGHERRHREESVRIFAQSWGRRVAEHGADRVLATGHSCRSQVARCVGFTPRHPLQVLRQGLATNRS
jgi:FAD/FMN-containing dehydrogenase/Fe-S oxidoreductase